MKSIVLIAEGHQTLRDRLGRLLGEHGYQVFSASDGLDCSQKLRQLKPQAVVLDQDLRWGGSEGVLAIMRDDPVLCRIPVILTFQPTTSLSPFPSRKYHCRWCNRWGSRIHSRSCSTAFAPR
jgi:DNA-binding NtrC family response regulator